ncbi:unnamed protein product [Kuraishia capsulata CBS 1993]|uniref:Short-chain dehydrogenase/reductase 3 n=1 Tax=Kuraishia capsulata CBS 1993 TaxID=1382522 RepID=W6MME8_9ASCO|nr:uncharacterized protein KUCA_T00002058001 [Kuraishia capsulata CBS 1993]CDK26087.1 unnamed protein product [Kuraishia capsulata CBS 1993]
MTGKDTLRFTVYAADRTYRTLSDFFIGTIFDPYRDKVLVTGGGSGLGREIAIQFKNTSATVIVLDVSIPDEDDENYIPGVKYYKCDVSKRSEVIKIGRLIKDEIGDVAVLINNAAITNGKAILDIDFEDIEKTVQVNLLSSFYTIKTFLPDMIKNKRGYVVTIASVLGYMSPARLSAYGASKSGLIALHESLTYELGPPAFTANGVKTLLVCPGQMKTNMFKGVKTPSTLLAPELDPKYVAKSVLKAVFMGRRGEIKLPFYSNFIPLFRAMPWPVVEVARCFSGIDQSMRKFAGQTKTASLASNSEKVGQ